MPSRISSEYKLMCAWHEARFSEKTVSLKKVAPDIDKILSSKFMLFVMRHAQNLIWTTKRHSTIGVLGHRKAKNPERSFELSAACRQEEHHRILLDITFTARSSENPGIGRVCRKMAEEGAVSGRFLPVELRDGNLYDLSSKSKDTKITPNKTDIYVVMDVFWASFTEQIGFVKRTKALDCLTAVCIYDVIPLLHPEIAKPDFADLFASTVPRMLAECDICFTISETALDDLKHVFATDEVLRHRAPTMFSFKLGGDFSGSDFSAKPVGRSMLPMKTHRRPFFLCVGTLEPKKGYSVVLDAFDTLWDSGVEADLLILGRPGWCTRAVQDRISNHPCRSDKLFWLANADDAMLEQAYRRSHCLIQASVAEGFGLPLVEAAHFGTPVIASDIDIFKEIGGSSFSYFKSEDSNSLVEAITTTLKHRPAAPVIDLLTWSESHEQLASKLWETARQARHSSTQ